MTTDRVYRSRLSHERAMAELERCAGTQFDPEVVSAFVELMNEQASLRNIG
jgi:HD-GYP domain-containing protein (c-di-GMP phosphodiesterase class II)